MLQLQQKKGECTMKLYQNGNKLMEVKPGEIYKGYIVDDTNLEIDLNTKEITRCNFQLQVVRYNNGYTYLGISDLQALGLQIYDVADWDDDQKNQVLQAAEIDPNNEWIEWSDFVDVTTWDGVESINLSDWDDVTDDPRWEEELQHQQQKNGFKISFFETYAIVDCDEWYTSEIYRLDKNIHGLTAGFYDSRDIPRGY